MKYLHISQRLSNGSIQLRFFGGCDGPQKFCTLAMGRLSIQLRFAGLSRKNYGELRRKPYAYQQAAIL